jgi:hypothetical protein
MLPTMAHAAKCDEVFALAVWWIVVNVVNGEVLIAHYLRSRLYSSSTWCGSKHFFLHFWQVQFADCFTEKAITSQSFGYSFLFIGMLFLSKKWRSQLGKVAIALVSR